MDIELIGSDRFQDPTPNARFTPEGIIYFNKATIASTDIAKFSFAQLGKDKKNDKILYIILHKNQPEGKFVNIRKQGGNFIVTGQALLAKLSYDARESNYNIEQKEYEGQTVLVLTLKKNK